MKLIFLDIDGVLNDDEFYEKIYKEHNENSSYWSSLDHDTFMALGHINPEKVELINYIVEHTGAKIVISSTWRNRGVKGMTTILNSRGLKAEIIGITPYLDFICDDKSYDSDNMTCPRGNEIEYYIQKHYPNHWNVETKTSSSELKSYVIIDDDADMLYYQKDNFIHTDNYYGLTKEDADKAITILNMSS